jgi:hypothetical protein
MELLDLVLVLLQAGEEILFLRVEDNAGCSGLRTKVVELVPALKLPNGIW